MWLFWLIVGITFVIAEILYNSFFLIWFAIGSFCAVAASFFTDNIAYQGSIFLIISLLLLFTLTRKISIKLISRPTVPTNIDSLIGKKGIVTQSIGKDYFENGLVKLDGEIWTALSQSGHPIEKGKVVQILEIKGVRLIVSPVES